MSATVTYKGRTITTAENQTRKLNTAGTWLEDDITIVDVTSGGSGSEYQSGIIQDAFGFIKISPNTAAGGVYFDEENCIVLYPTQAGSGQADLGTKTITSNGTYNASSDNLDGYSSVTVAIPVATGISF